MAVKRFPLALHAAEFSSTTAPSFVKVVGTNFPVRSLAFDPAADEACFYVFKLPADYSSDIRVVLLWYADTASSGVVRWGAALAAITPNTDTQDVETDGLAAETAADDTHLGTTGQRVHEIEIDMANLDGAAAGDLVFLRIRREGSHTNDTMAGDALLLHVQVRYDDGT